MLVEIDYTNWRGERASRWIVPLELTFGSNSYHERQWLILAIDIQRLQFRTFAAAKVHSWRAVDEKIARETIGQKFSAKIGNPEADAVLKALKASQTDNIKAGYLWEETFIRAKSSGSHEGGQGPGASPAASGPDAQSGDAVPPDQG